MSLIDRSARASRRVVTLSVGALVAASIAQAACMGAPEPAGPRLSIAVAPLDLPGIAEACYDLRATAGPGGSGELVWSEPDLCSTRYGDGRGALSYVGTCVAGVTHTVLLTMVSLSDADGPVGFVNPCPADAPCALESPCVANADTPVTFNLTVMRGAEQGFFDVAVSFADLFCSAKVDCLGGPEVGLFPPGGEARVPAVVMAFACTGGAGADVDTQLYLGDVRLDCDGASLSLPVSGPPGNAYSLASPPPSPILQLATYRGHGDLAAAGETPWNALYYNVALALDPTRVATSCELTATATAADHAWLPPFVTPAHTAYPLMRVDLPLVVGPGASGYACARHPLGDGPEDGIWTEYTGLDAALVMDRRAFVADGQVQVEERRRCAVGHGGCDVHATCTDLPPAVACACDDGWDGDGLACDDLDECQPTSPCAAYEDCANTPGSFECRAITAAADAGPSFAPTFVGLSTIPGRVLVHATGLGRLTVGSVTASGDFSVSQNGCTSPVEPGASCPIDVVFAPSAGGPRAGTLSIDSDAGPTPLSVALAGVGVVPEALEIGPADAALAPGYALTFAAVGGVEPYSFSVASGGGTFAGAVYTAPLEVGTAVVRVTDHVGATRETSVTIGQALAIGPGSLALAVGNSATFSASGGVGPYSFSLVAPSDGSLVGAGATATYTAPAAPGGATVRVTDSFGMSADALVTVGPALAIDPPAVTLPVRGTRQFTTSGGVAPVTLSIAAGGGSLQAGLFAAPSTAQTVVVRATDARGNLADATVTVVPPLALSPTDVLLAVGNSQTFVASGGAGGYSFSVIGDGSVDAVGVYTAAAAPGGATVRVSDAIGGHADASVTVVPALVIDPPSVTIAVGKTAVFTSTGGVGGARFDVASGSGSFVGGTYTAPQTPGSATVRVTDNRGNTSLATVTIASLPVIDPTPIVVMVGTTQAFSVSGGVAPYSFSVVGAGSVTSDGVFTAPGTTGVTVVRVTDAIQSSADASVIVSPTLAMVPAAKTLAVGNTFTFSADGGVPGYAYALVAPARGTLVGATYTAPSSAGSDTLRVTDARGHTSDATITVNAALTLGPSSATLAVGDSKAFTAAGGVPPYTFTVPAGGGAFAVPSVGTYTTPTSAGSATVRVTDSFGNSAEAAVTINAALAISPSTVSVGAGTTQTFTATGGVGAYTFTVASGLGSVTSPGGVYTAPGSASPAVVRVSDAAGHSADAAVTVVNLSTYAGSIVEPNLVAYNGCCSNWQPAWKFNITTNGAAHTVSIDGTFTALHSNGIPPSGTWGYTVSRPGAADENVNKTISGFPVAEHLTKSYTLAAGTWVVNFSQFLRITFTVAANGTVTCNGTDGVTSYVDTSSGNQNRVPFLTISNTVQ